MAQSEQATADDVRRKALQENLAKLPDDDLVGGVPFTAIIGTGPGDMMMESLRRLKTSIDLFNTTTSRLTRALLFLTVILLVIEAGRIFNLF